MEIRASWFADICDVSRQTFNSAKNSDKVQPNNDEVPKYNIHEPLNLEYLRSHGKSILDVENYIKVKSFTKKKKKQKQSSSVGRSPIQKKTVVTEKTEDQSMKLLEAVKIVLSREYSEEEFKKIKSMIFGEMKKLI